MKSLRAIRMAIIYWQIDWLMARVNRLLKLKP
jgi:hypothetical protein